MVEEATDVETPLNLNTYMAPFGSAFGKGILKF